MSFRSRFADLPRIMCCLPAVERRIRPPPVALNRLAAARFVFILGIRLASLEAPKPAAPAAGKRRGPRFSAWGEGVKRGGIAVTAAGVATATAIAAVLRHVHGYLNAVAAAVYGVYQIGDPQALSWMAGLTTVGWQHGSSR